MSGESTLEKYRRRLEKGVQEYEEKGRALHAAIQGPVTNFNTLCDGMALTAGRYLRHVKCGVVREVMPYDLNSDSFVVQHRFSRGDAQTNIEVRFSNSHVAHGGQIYPIAEIATVEDAVADAVLSFYMPR